MLRQAYLLIGRLSMTRTRDKSEKSLKIQLAIATIYQAHLTYQMGFFYARW